MVQIKCLSNGLYSLKNSHIPFGMGFQPPPPYGGFPFEQHFSYYGAPLIVSADYFVCCVVKCGEDIQKRVFVLAEVKCCATV